MLASCKETAGLINVCLLLLVFVCTASAHCDPEALLPSIVKTFGHKNPNIQGACLDLTINLLAGEQQAACATFVGSAKQVRNDHRGLCATFGS